MKPAGEMPDAAEFGLLLAFLAQHRPADVPANQWHQEIASVIGVAGGGTRAEIVEDLRAWMKNWVSA